VSVAGRKELIEALECLLFVADGPSTASALAEALEVTEEEVIKALKGMSSRYEQESGLQLIQIAGGYQLCTKPVYADAVARFLQPQKQRLTKPALEALAIVAYRQPITTAAIEEIRGVDCAGVLKTLVERQLVREVGRKQAPGRPILYGTTYEFLHQFGLENLGELPPLEITNGEERNEKSD
jgi:segregation and condensation protein B